MEAVAQNQRAIIWWKVPGLHGGGERGSGQTGGGARATKTKAAIGGASRKRGSGSVAAEAGFAGDGERGTVVGGTGNGGSVLEDNLTPETVGFVVYRYRLDGREWHKKGATHVDGAKTVSASIKALSNGLVYRWRSRVCAVSVCDGSLCMPDLVGLFRYKTARLSAGLPAPQTGTGRGVSLTYFQRSVARVAKV